MAYDFDAIIIGAGIGGLSCGALLAHEGLKVLVLEQHSKIGGYAHTFKRRNFTFESGIHSVPLSSDGLVMHILKHLGIDSNIECIELPSMYHIASNDGSYTMPSKKGDILQYFKHLNCSQSEINAILETSKQFYDSICTPVISGKSTNIMENINFGSRFYNCSYQKLITSLTTNSTLRTLLFGQWPYAGVSANQCSALYSFSMFLMHMEEGSHFCKGGFSSLANALADAVTRNGSSILTKKNVSRLNVENNQISHVITDDGTEYRAPIFVSNISPYLLHHDLLPEANRGKLFLRRLKNLNPSTSCVIVYLGMKPSVTTVLPDNINFWYDTWDLDSIYKNIMENKKDSIDHLIMLRAHDEENSNQTLTLMNFVRPDYSSNWSSEKNVIANKMIEKLKALYPGIEDMIELMEVGSPDTFYRYTKNTQGALYGFENTKDLYGEAKLPITTHIPNLFQTGHWGKPGGGVWNVIFNSFGASKLILEKM